MPTTRSQAAEEKTARVYEDPPASPSATASVSAPAPIGTTSRAQADPSARVSALPAMTSRAAAAAAAAAATVAAAPDTREERSRAPSMRSQRSTASAVARIRQAEFDAQERLAEIERKELQLQAALIKRRLALDVATIREETDRDTIVARETIEVDNRIADWLKNAQPGRDELPHMSSYEEVPSAVRASALYDLQGERTERVPQTERHREDMANRARHQRENDGQRSHHSFYRYAPTPRQDQRGVTIEPPRRNRSPTPGRRSPTPGRSRERGIDRLAEVLERMVVKRPPPRQAQELPIFSGAPNEWLLFRAAMRDSTKMYGYTQAENLARMRTCIRGEARELVAALLYTAADPATIMQTLEQYYGRPEIIIDKTLDDIKKLPRPGPTASELNSFAIRLQNIVSVLTCIDEKGYLQNPMLARQVTEKLSPHIRARWCDYAEEYGSRREPEIVTLSHFLMREADRAVRFAYSSTGSGTKEPTRNAPAAKPSYGPPKRPEGKKRGAATYAATDSKDEKMCLCCGAEHDTVKCSKLKEMTVPQRWEWAKEARVCFRCLNSRHRRMTCTANKCGVNECRHPHHVLLHGTQQNALKGEQQRHEITASAHAVMSTGAVLLKICPVIIRGPDGLEVETHALLDEGSTITLIDEEIARQVNAHGTECALRLHGLTATRQEPKSQSVALEIRGARSSFHPIQARTVRCLNITSQAIAAECLNYEHLQQLPRNEVCYGLARPRILLGADHWHLIVSRKLLTGARNEPAASLTELGWVVHGTVPRTIVAKENPIDGATVLHVRAPEHRERLSYDKELHDLVTTHFAIDALGISSKNKPVKEDERAKEIFNKTARLTDGRYEVGLPWRTNDTHLPPSFDMALRRLRTIERKMDRDTKFRQAYTSQVDNLLKKGYAAPVEHTDDSAITWYLPHFAVTNPNKPGKVRLVFDAAASTNGRCLNDELLAGPDMLNTLYGILFRFREKPIAIAADIREMFLRIKIRPEDRAAQQFLWRGDDRKGPPQKYVMNSMIFGARSSPFLAHSVRNRNAEKFNDAHPRALYAITKNHYMDDWVDSFESEEIAALTIEEVQRIHEQAGFELAGWNSNRSHLLDNILEQDKANAPKELGANAHPYGKTLGMMWLPETDELAFNTAMPRVPSDVRDGTRTPTKREMLGAVMSIFDPLGLLSPFTITAKITLQELWRKRIGWDEQLPAEEAIAFLEWINGLTSVAGLRVPRCYANHMTMERSLHVFTDASEQAYAAAAYWRLTRPDGSIDVVLVAGKAKVAPMKAQSIPRMELQACLIGARLSSEICKEHRWETEVTYWSDSKTALHWIRNDSARYTPYVAHRLSEIGELTPAERWRWVPTAQNVADDATRHGKTSLLQHDRWFIGPAFLREPEEQWPQEENQCEDETVANVIEQENVMNVKRFSSFDRALRAMATVLLFIDKCRKRATTMNVRHLKEAELMLIRESQRDSFPEEIKRLSSGKNVEKSSRLSKLDPVYEENIIRLNGRIDAANVPEYRKRPPILDGRHPLARLLMKREHVTNGHAGREHVVNNLRQRYWIVKLRTSVRTVLNECIMCRMRRKAPPIPVKGNLPSERLDAYARPFTRCGVDCFGPMTITIGRRREKRWGMLFTCLVTRAVHIELLPSLSTDSAIMALRRMAARRGWPQTIMSDNGTNFRGADIELKNAYKEWASELKDYALNKGIEWRFIDPGAPNQGGAWERLIRSVKTALAVILKERTPKEETLSTVMAEIENILNSRPLTHVSVSPEDAEALTPNHFLLGSGSGLPVTGTCDVADKRAWRAAQALADRFWARWVNEYLPTLTPRGDVRHNRAEQITEGDVVIIADGLLPRNVWPRGLVVRAIVGPDGVVRSADVRTRGGIFRRPVRRLIVLDHKEEAREATLGGDCCGQQA